MDIAQQRHVSAPRGLVWYGAALGTLLVAVWLLWPEPDTPEQTPFVPQLVLQGSSHSSPFALGGSAQNTATAVNAAAMPPPQAPDEPLQNTPIPALSGLELANQFDALVRKAKAANPALAHALSERLRSCTPQGRQLARQQAGYATPDTRRATDWQAEADYFERTQRDRCDGITVVQMAKAAELEEAALSGADPEARISQALRGIEALEAAAQQRNGAQATSPSVASADDQLAAKQYLQDLESLAQMGNVAALQALGEVFSRATVTPRNETKTFAYQLIATSDWSNPQLDTERLFELRDTTAEFKQRVLNEATPLFISCCFKKGNTQP